MLRRLAGSELSKATAVVLAFCLACLSIPLPLLLARPSAANSITATLYLSQGKAANDCPHHRWRGTRGEVHTLTLADSSVETWSYNGNGDVSAYTNPLSQTISYTYDDAGRQTGVDYPAGTDTSFSYDDSGRRTQMVDSTGDHRLDLRRRIPDHGAFDTSGRSRIHLRRRRPQAHDARGGHGNHELCLRCGGPAHLADQPPLGGHKLDL